MSVDRSWNATLLLLSQQQSKSSETGFPEVKLPDVWFTCVGHKLDGCVGLYHACVDKANCANGA